MKFCESLTKYVRTKTIPVRIGGITVGGGNPIAVQSMTNTDTMDAGASAAQVMRIRGAGGHIVRLSTPTVRDARNLEQIVRLVREQGGTDTGIVADVHFTPEIAMVAAQYADKVRINPGNYRREGGELEALIDRCRERGVALRIGVNHGSLAPQVVERWGDTPEGMVASAMEFLHICREREFDQVAVSMKSSNVRVMVHAYRLLAARMREAGMHYPLHLGVTEAGDAMQGRVKSAVGIGALLADGLGDTIRVSLSEAPENEIPVAQALAGHFESRTGHDAIPAIADPSLYHPFEYRPRRTLRAGRLGDGQPPLLRSEFGTEETAAIGRGEIAVLECRTSNPPAEWRAAILNLEAAGDRRPVVLRHSYPAGTPLEEFMVMAAADTGLLFLDGLADGLWIECEGIPQERIDAVCYHILQAARVRTTQTEYIACPGCARTLYDLEGTLAAIKSRTSHLVGLKIGVMGCIVNGPGEMADADYGYVGAGPGRITLYRGREVVRRNIPQAEAIDALLDLIDRER